MCDLIWIKSQMTLGLFSCSNAQYYVVLYLPRYVSKLDIWIIYIKCLPCQHLWRYFLLVFFHFKNKESFYFYNFIDTRHMCARLKKHSNTTIDRNSFVGYPIYEHGFVINVKIFQIVFYRTLTVSLGQKPLCAILSDAKFYRCSNITDGMPS